VWLPNLPIYFPLLSFGLLLFKFLINLFCPAAIEVFWHFLSVESTSSPFNKHIVHSTREEPPPKHLADKYLLRRL
jgi:hypothetical protein